MAKGKAMARKHRPFLVYIAGSMAGRPVRDVLFERKLARTFLERNGLASYDPAQSEGLEALGPGALIDTMPTMEIMESYVEKDERNLDKCDAILVLSGDRSSDGTWHEMCRALYKLHIPIVMVAPKRCRGEVVSFSSIKVKEIQPTIWEAAQRLREIAWGMGYAVRAA